MVQRPPAAGEIVAKRERDQKQQPNHPGHSRKMQDAAAAFYVHEEKFNHVRFRDRDCERKPVSMRF